MSAENRSHVESSGVPWENDYGYVQAIRRGDSIYVSGQVSHRGSEPELVHAAPVDENGKVTDFSNMEGQMRQSYANAAELLARFGASLDDVVEEVIYVLDMHTAFAVAGPVRKEAYGKDVPQVASTLFGVAGLTFPGQLIEVKLIARVG